MKLIHQVLCVTLLGTAHALGGIAITNEAGRHGHGSA